MGSHFKVFIIWSIFLVVIAMFSNPNVPLLKFFELLNFSACPLILHWFFTKFSAKHKQKEKENEPDKP